MSKFEFLHKFQYRARDARPYNVAKKKKPYIMPQSP